MAEGVASTLRSLLRSQGIVCIVTCRLKDIDSLLRKALTTRRLDQPEAITDKAGVRVTVQFPDDIKTVCSLLRDPSRFDCRREEDKIESLGVDRIGYLGIHFDVVLAREELAADLPEVRGELWCEVQVQTAAQTLFSTVSHPLLTSRRSIRRGLSRALSTASPSSASFSITSSVLRGSRS